MILKRDGRECCFRVKLIEQAILKAFYAASEEHTRKHQEFFDLLSRIISGDLSAEEEMERYRREREEEIRRSEELRQFKVYLGMRDKIEELNPKDTDARLKAHKLRMEQRSQRQPQGDGKTTRLAATLPVPPLMNVKGGQLYALRIGV